MNDSKQNKGLHTELDYNNEQTCYFQNLVIHRSFQQRILLKQLQK